MLPMNPQLHHTVAFARMADELRAAERRRRAGSRARRETAHGLRGHRARARLLRRFA